MNIHHNVDYLLQVSLSYLPQLFYLILQKTMHNLREIEYSVFGQISLILYTFIGKE